MYTARDQDKCNSLALIYKHNKCFALMSFFKESVYQKRQEKLRLEWQESLWEYYLGSLESTILPGEAATCVICLDYGNIRCLDCGAGKCYCQQCYVKTHVRQLHIPEKFDVSIEQYLISYNIT